MSLYKTNIKAKAMGGESVGFSSFEGKTTLIVNTASKCGFTPQFEGLEELYKKHKEKDFIVLGFPCNQFKNQDPGSNQEILNVCQINYGVTFPMFQKIDVNGKDRHPLFQYLIENNESNNKNDIKWNFEKFLVDKNGTVVKRFNSLKKPRAIEKDIIKLL